MLLFEWPGRSRSQGDAPHPAKAGRIGAGAASSDGSARLSNWWEGPLRRKESAGAAGYWGVTTSAELASLAASGEPMRRGRKDSAQGHARYPARRPHRRHASTKLNRYTHRITSSVSRGEHDAWRCRPSIARFSCWLRGASCFPVKCRGPGPELHGRPDHRLSVRSNVYLIS